MNEDVTRRLASLGYEVQTADGWLLDFVIRKVEQHICDNCNVTAVPVGLHGVAVDRAAGEFLFALKGAGRLTVETGFDLDVAIKQITEGDTTMVFAVDGTQSPEQRLDKLLRHLMTAGAGQFATYRRLAW